MAGAGEHTNGRVELTTTTVAGGGGVRLHVVETGNPRGRPIVFLHGFSQSWHAWSRQMRSDLTDDYRLVAMDLRGHGRSDKPEGAYADSSLWADDVHAVMDALGLEAPVLCGWSYGSLVILDYVRHHGDGALGGIAFVAGLSRLGSAEAMAVISPEVRSLVPGFFASDVQESAGSLASLLRLCFAREPSADDLYQMLGYNLGVPPHVRQALFSRVFDSDDVMASIRRPVLLAHGANDAVVDPIVVEQHKAAIPHAETLFIADAGHAPFWEDAARFNRRLRAFCEGL
jgi:pimeloyl-ACP methyl ester carboxylesterase